MKILPLVLALALAACGSQQEAKTPDASPKEESGEQRDPKEALGSAIAEQAAALREQYPDAVIRLAAYDVEAGEMLAGDGDLESVFAAASTTKPFTVAAALQLGADPQAKLDTGDGKYVIAGSEIHDREVMGQVNLYDAVARSSNVAIVKLVESLGLERVYKEVTELIYLPEFSTMEEGAAYVALFGGTSHYPLAPLVQRYAVFANHGVDPHTGERYLTDMTCNQLMDILRYAVESEQGTGHAAEVEGFNVRGKTGTASVDGKVTSTFIGFATLDEKDYVVGVVVEGLAEESVEGVPAARAFAELLHRL